MHLKPGRSEALVGNAYRYIRVRKVKKNGEVSVVDPPPSQVLAGMVVSVWEDEHHSSWATMPLSSHPRRDGTGNPLQVIWVDSDRWAESLEKSHRSDT